MRVLHASTRGAGHFIPLVPFIEAARRNGHEVLVIGPPGLATAVEAAGFPFRVGAAPPDEELEPLWHRVRTVSRDEQNAIVVGEIFAGLNVRAMLPHLRKAIDEWRPDVVLREPSECASALAAELAGIPHVRIGNCLGATEEHFIDLGAPKLAEAREAAGLEPDPRGERLRESSAAAGMPMAAPAYGAALEAVADLPVHVLLTVGREGDPEAFGAQPAHVRIERWVPQADVLGHAAAAVGHGGAGTTIGALAAGLPQVVVPLFADQPENARRVAAVGVGLAVAPPEAATIRAAIVRVLEEQSFRAAAAAVAAEMRALPPVDDAFDAL